MAKIYGNPITLGGSSNKSDFQLAATFEIKSSDFTDVTTSESMEGAVYTKGTFNIPFPLTINKKTYNTYGELIDATGNRRNILFSASCEMFPNVYASNGSDQSYCNVIFNAYDMYDSKLYMFVKFKK